MAYMKKNVNMVLIVIVIALALAFTVFTTVTQESYYNMTSSFDQKSKELSAVTETLNLEKSKLDETSYQLTIKKSREESLSKISEELSQEKGKLETEKSKLNADLAQKSQDLLAAQDQANDLALEVSNLKDEVDDLKRDVKKYRDRSESRESEKNQACALITGEKPSFC